MSGVIQYEVMRVIRIGRDNEGIEKCIKQLTCYYNRNNTSAVEHVAILHGIKEYNF